MQCSDGELATAPNHKETHDMAEDHLEVGSLAWTDLTVPDAESLRDFYAAVVGWRPEPVSMGEYADFNMVGPESGEPRVGICHARDSNAYLPPQWLVYVIVADLDASLERCRTLGGEIIGEPRRQGESARYCVIRDPAGAVLALYQAR